VSDGGFLRHISRLLHITTGEANQSLKMYRKYWAPVNKRLSDSSSPINYEYEQLSATNTLNGCSFRKDAWA
jgi:hypothetical protein